GVTVTEVGLQGSGSTITNLTTTVAGAYGTLSLSADGSLIYLVTNTNPVVNALAPGQTLTEVFNYKVTNSSSLSSWAKLTITINGTNDAPVAVADTNTVQEDAGLNATGSVLTNDTDVDNNESRTVTKVGTASANTAVASGTTSANGTPVTGTYGTLTLGADGTYSYSLNNALPAVQALTLNGATLSDVFRYEVTDAYGATATTTLSITITGNNEPPVNSFPSTATTSVSTPLNFTGSNLISVGDADNNLSWTALAVDHGTLSFTSSPPAGLVVTGNGSGAVRISGSQADINTALALLNYTPTAGYTGVDYLTIASQDAAFANDSDSVQITIGTPLIMSVTGPANSVSEGSTALFTVNFSQALTSNTDVSLSLQDVSTQAADYSLTKVYYLSSGVEQALTVTGNSVTVPTGVSTFYVRVTTTADSPAVFEGSESFRLTAGFTDSTLAASDPTADNSSTATMVDDGSGTVYGPTGNTLSTAADDDRTVGVTAYGPVNEGSTYAMFKVDGTPGYAMDLTLQAASSGTAATTSGFTFQFSTDGGTTWTTYDATHKPTVPAGGSFFVRVNITTEADTTFEGAETFALKANYSTNTAKSAAADATIIDDGTGSKYDGSLSGSSPKANTDQLDDDRPKPIIPVAPPAAQPPANVKPPEAPAGPPVSLPKPFNSTVQPLEQKLAPPAELPALPIEGILTSNSGFPIVAIESAPPGLTLNKGITDQFVEQGTNTGKFTVPYDAFMHSKQDAVIKLQAKQVDDSALPAWVKFDPQAGTFEATPPANFKGKVELKVIARDEDGREATSIFRLFVGEETPAPVRPQSRDSLSEKIRLTAKRQLSTTPIASKLMTHALPASAATHSPAG
ncbi:MAG: hypothetical protein FGM44_09935, partial [Limnohabitans sp.]|nr:hypothetical protein [Limnohabitans sp.]